MLPANRPDIALQVANSSFACVMADEVTHCILGELDLLGRNAVLFDLSRNQILESDMDLLFFGITLQFDYLHAVAQRLGYRIQHVRSRDEQHL